MEITFRVKNFDLSENAKNFISEKISGVKGLFHEDTVVHVYLLKREKDYKCEIKVQRGKDFVRSEEIGKTIQYAVNNAINTLTKRVRKVKSMKITKKRGNDALLFKNESKYFDIERRKELSLDSCSEEEAVLLLESLNHSFYIFKNSDLDDLICVLYKRESGYGLIEVKN